MSSVNTLIGKRLNKSDRSNKMSSLAKQSASGNLSSFAGMFGMAELSIKEKDFLEAILNEYTTGEGDLSSDLQSLISITSEVKAINNQAAILHGERIKKAHDILIRYRDGAFTSWLIATYGNRQTPYNFLQYFEFYQAMPKALHPQIELMPRQAVYTLASREGSLERKKKIVEGYQGETKAQLLSLIREAFPLSDKDKRKRNTGQTTIQELNKLCLMLSRARSATINKKQKHVIFDLLDELRGLVEQCKSR